MLISLYLSASAEWGWNPATFQAIGSIAVFRTLAVALWAIFHTRGEASLRTRPWVGIIGFDYASGLGTTQEPVEGLMLHYHNVGLLPAHSLEIRHVTVAVADNDYFELDGWTIGTVFPNEPSREAITFHGDDATRFIQWREAHREVVVQGTLSYLLGKKKYHTEFEINLHFSDAPTGDPPKYPTGWSNETAT